MAFRSLQIEPLRLIKNHVQYLLPGLHHFIVTGAAFRGPTTTTTYNGCIRYFISFRIFIIFAKVSGGHVHITVVTGFNPLLVPGWTGRNKERFRS